MITALAVSAVNGKAVKEVATRAVVKTGAMLGANIAAYKVNNMMLNKMPEEDRKDPVKMNKFRRNSLVRSSIFIGCTAAIADAALSAVISADNTSAIDDSASSAM